MQAWIQPNFSLSSNVPNIQFEPVCLDRFYIEPLGGGDGGDVLAGESLEDGGLASIVKTKQQDSQLSLWGGFQFPGNRSSFSIVWKL